jgi:hypothetical protein
MLLVFLSEGYLVGPKVYYASGVIRILC